MATTNNIRPRLAEAGGVRAAIASNISHMILRQVETHV
jgi:hypothetical protein